MLNDVKRYPRFYHRSKEVRRVCSVGFNAVVCGVSQDGLCVMWCNDTLSHPTLLISFCPSSTKTFATPNPSFPPTAHRPGASCSYLAARYRCAHPSQRRRSKSDQWNTP